MNKDQAKGTLKDAAGKVQAGAGKLIGNKEMQGKGLQKQVVGLAQKSLGDAKEIFKNVREAAKAAGTK